MQRLIVAVLAAVDAVIAAAVGLAVLLAPLTIFWLVNFGVGGDWSVLWPTVGKLWQFGHGVPLAITLPPEVLVAARIAPEAAEFTLSLIPLAFLAFTALFALRSGGRAVRAGSWPIGLAAGAVVFAAITWGVAATSTHDLLQASFLESLLFPAIVYISGLLVGVIVSGWRHDDGGVWRSIRQWCEDFGDWGLVPEAVVRGAVAAGIAVLGAGGIVLAVWVFVNMDEAVALFEALGVDLLGASVVALVQLAYVPTLLVWASSWLAGPGFAVGTGTAVSPAGSELGVVPAIPALGILPQGTSTWWMLVVLVPVAAGALAGWIVRSRLFVDHDELGMLPRGVIALGIALGTGGMGAAAAALASGSIGPGRMADLGPHPGMVAASLALAVFVGAAILMLSPLRQIELRPSAIFAGVDRQDTDPVAEQAVVPSTPAESNPDEEETVPIDAGFLGEGDEESSQPDSGR